MALSPLTGQIVCLGVKIMQKQENLWVELKNGAFMVDPSIADGNMQTIELPNGIKSVFCSEKH